MEYNIEQIKFEPFDSNNWFLALICKNVEQANDLHINLNDYKTEFRQNGDEILVSVFLNKAQRFIEKSFIPTVEQILLIKENKVTHLCSAYSYAGKLFYNPNLLINLLDPPTKAL